MKTTLTAEQLAADFLALKSVSKSNGRIHYTNGNGDTTEIRSWVTFDRVLINNTLHGKALFTRTMSKAAWRIVSGGAA